MASKFMNGKIRLSVIPKSYGKLQVFYFEGQEELSAHLKNVDYSESKYLIVEYVSGSNVVVKG